MLTDSNMASGISPAHADVHVVTWATYIKALGCIRNTVRLMALCGYTDRKLQLVSGGLHVPLTSAWLPEAAKPEDITKALGSAQAACVHMNLRLQSSLDHRQQHNLLWCLGPWWSFEEVQSRK